MSTEKTTTKNEFNQWLEEVILSMGINEPLCPDDYRAFSAEPKIISAYQKGLSAKQCAIQMMGK